MIEMAAKDDCRNCTHSKDSHKLVVEYPGGPKVLPGTIMYDTQWNHKLNAHNVHVKNMSQRMRMIRK